MRIAILPSNQHLNQYAGLPSVTEEKWAAAVSAWVQRHLNTNFHVEAAIFHVPGAGDRSIDELNEMFAQANAWDPDYYLSIHSDAVGDQAQTGVLMLMARELDRYDGIRLGRQIAWNVNLPYKGAWVWGNEARKINFLTNLRTLERQGSLVEIGEHATVAEAAWNWNHIKEVGLGIAEALAIHYEYKRREVPMTDEQVALLEQTAFLVKRARLSDIARSFDTEIILAKIDRDEAMVERLRNDKLAAIERERRALGI